MNCMQDIINTCLEVLEDIKMIGKEQKLLHYEYAASKCRFFLDRFSTNFTAVSHFCAYLFTCILTRIFSKRNQVTSLNNQEAITLCYDDARYFYRRANPMDVYGVMRNIVISTFNINDVVSTATI